jgi:hypothetical protein
MTAHAGAPPGKRRGPVVTPDPSRIEVATTDTAAAMVDDRSDQDDRHRCRLCPICSCGWPCCRTDVEVAVP